MCDIWDGYIGNNVSPVTCGADYDNWGAWCGCMVISGASFADAISYQTGLMLAMRVCTINTLPAEDIDSQAATFACLDALVDWLVGEGAGHLDVRNGNGSSTIR
jgi:hypothetical protein